MTLQRRRRKRGFSPSKKMAEAVLRKRKTEVIENKFLDIKRDVKVLFDDFAQEYLVYSQNNKKQKSYQRDITNIKHLKAYFGGKFYNEIAPYSIEKIQIRTARKCLSSECKQRVSLPEAPFLPKLLSGIKPEIPC